MVRTGFGGRIRRARIVRRVFGELDLGIGGQRAKDLVGRDVMKAEAFRAPGFRPVFARRLQHVVGAGDVGLDKIARPVNGAVHMAFRGQMHDHIRLPRRKDPSERRAVTDVCLFKHIARRVRDVFDIVEAGGIGQRVEVDHLMPARNRQPNNGGPDEPRASGHKYFHALSSQWKGLSKSLNKGAFLS